MATEIRHIDSWISSCDKSANQSTVQTDIATEIMKPLYPTHTMHKNS